jgi:hypothetical protein
MHKILNFHPNLKKSPQGVHLIICIYKIMQIIFFQHLSNKSMFNSNLFFLLHSSSSSEQKYNFYSFPFDIEKLFTKKNNILNYFSVHAIKIKFIAVQLTIFLFIFCNRSRCVNRLLSLNVTETEKKGGKNIFFAYCMQMQCGRNAFITFSQLTSY